MNSESTYEGLALAAVAAAIFLPLMIWSIRRDYKKAGKDTDFRISRLLIGLFVGVLYFGSLLAAGLYLRDRWHQAPLYFVSFGFASMLVIGVGIVKRAKIQK
ncbi:MAG: hypothetical protein WC661_12105 [Opitutaceae bacterium]|jgi:hypothetical protein